MASSKKKTGSGVTARSRQIADKARLSIIKAQARKMLPELHGIVLVLVGDEKAKAYTRACCPNHEVGAIEIAIDMLKERLAKQRGEATSVNREELH